MKKKKKIWVISQNLESSKFGESNLNIDIGSKALCVLQCIIFLPTSFSGCSYLILYTKYNILIKSGCTRIFLSIYAKIRRRSYENNSLKIYYIILYYIRFNLIIYYLIIFL